MSDVRGNSRYVSHQKTIKAFCRRAGRSWGAAGASNQRVSARLDSANDMKPFTNSAQDKNITSLTRRRGQELCIDQDAKPRPFHDRRRNLTDLELLYRKCYRKHLGSGGRGLIVSQQITRGYACRLNQM